MTDVTPLRRNVLAVASLTLGIIGFLLSLTTPIPFIPLISLFAYPLGLGAMAAGWAGERRAKANGDATGVAQARWGLRLGCLSWIIEVITRIITAVILAGLLVTAIKAWQDSR
ncbi:MAG: hypothetical protein AAB217_19800 [Chloroflexota bacterium]